MCWLKVNGFLKHAVLLGFIFGFMNVEEKIIVWMEPWLQYFLIYQIKIIIIIC